MVTRMIELITQIDEQTYRELERRAQRRQRSVSEEAAELLRLALGTDRRCPHHAPPVPAHSAKIPLLYTQSRTHPRGSRVSMMTTLVIDASVAAQWLVPDNNTFIIHARRIREWRKAVRD
jgi:plasmid stability protein